MNDLIIIKQLPIIEERLKQTKEEISKKVENALSLECVENTVKTVKTLRANLNKEFKDFEDKRKDVKSKILSPYEQFEAIYKECVSNIFEKADEELKCKIDKVESGLKQKKRDEVCAYFNEYLQSNGIDFITFENANINVTLTASIKSLKEQSKAFIDRICDDLALIDTQTHKAEILIEYKRSLNASAAITTVTARHKAIEDEQRRSEQQAQISINEEQAIGKVDAVLAAPREIKPETTVDSGHTSELIYKLTFSVWGTKEKLQDVKQFLIDGGYRYE